MVERVLIMDEAAGSMPATSIFCRTHIHTHTYIYVYIHIWCVCAFAKQKKIRGVQAREASRRRGLRATRSPAGQPITAHAKLGQAAFVHMAYYSWHGRIVCICMHLHQPPCTICICTSPLCCGRDALCAWHAASGMRCVRIMHIISSPCAAGKCGEEKPDRYMYPKIAPLDVRYSLVGQDTALSPRRPGFDSRYRNSMWYFYHTGIRPCTDVV